MPKWTRLGRSAVWLVSALLSSGCAGASLPSDALLSELQRERAQAAEQRLRVLELEARLARLESGALRSDGAERSGGDQAAVLEAISRLIALNERALSAVQSGGHALTQPLGVKTSPVLEQDCGEGLNPEEQIRRLMAQIRSRPSAWRGGLSRQENDALRLLTRPERSLDRRNPLQDW